MDACVFCKIGNGELPAEFVYQDEEITAFKDVKPSAPIHILIVPKKHLGSVNDVSKDDQALLGKMILLAKKIAVDLGVEKSGYRLCVNNGPDACQAVQHLHMHLLAGQKLNPK